VNNIYIVKDDTRQYLRPMQPNEVETTESGVPTAYRFIGKTIFFDCPPNAEFLANYTSFHVEYQRLDDPFVTGDTTQQPGFLGTYHHILAYKAVGMYMLQPNPTYALRLSSEDEDRPGMFESGLKQLKESTAKMNGAFPKNITAEPIHFR
jgi:hypothetical protein